MFYCIFVLALIVTCWVEYAYSLSKTRPNFIFLLTDDQDALFNSSNIMPNLQKYLVNECLSFEYSYVATPICCPSRGELLTGRYYHNIGPPYPPNGTCMHIDPYYPVFHISKYA